MFQRGMIFFVIFVLFGNLSFAADTNSTKDEIIVLPNIDLSIEDESEIPLQNQDSKLSDQANPDLTHIDLEELANSGVNEKIKSELDADSGSEQSSLSGMRMYYGSYGNLFTDINLGKSVGNFNYLISYLRNKRESTGINGNLYFNTEMGVDDLGLDLIWSAGDQLDLHSSLGYYERSIGLYTNTAYLSEKLVYFPIQTGLSYHPDINSILSLDIGGKYLTTSFKEAGLYTNDAFWNADLSAAYQVNWSQNNFLKSKLDYKYGQFLSTGVHQAQFSFLDQFPVLSFLALEIGAGGVTTSDDTLFWYPHAFAILHTFKDLNFRFGVTGVYQDFSIEKAMNWDQVFYGRVLPARGWSGQAQMAYSPLHHVTLRVASEYDQMTRFLTWSYDSTHQVYKANALTNVMLWKVKPSLESIIADWMIFTISYVYQDSPKRYKFLFFYQQELNGKLTLRYTPFGSEVYTSISWKSGTQTRHGVNREGTLRWDVELKQRVNKQIYLDLRLNNLLNQDIFGKDDLPEGGFNLYGGVKILL